MIISFVTYYIGDETVRHSVCSFWPASQSAVLSSNKALFAPPLIEKKNKKTAKRILQRVEGNLWTPASGHCCLATVSWLVQGDRHSLTALKVRPRNKIFLPSWTCLSACESWLDSSPWVSDFWRRSPAVGSECGRRSWAAQLSLFKEERYGMNSERGQEPISVLRASLTESVAISLDIKVSCSLEDGTISVFAFDLLLYSANAGQILTFIICVYLCCLKN